MATANTDEYVTVDSVPLDTAAWRTLDHSDLYDLSGKRGQGMSLAQRRGERAHARMGQPRPLMVPLMVFGQFDSDGNAHADSRTGLRVNLDELKNALSPSLNTEAGTVTAQHVMADGTTRQTACQLTGQLDARPAGPEHMRCVADLWLPEGVWRDTTATSASATDSFPLTVPNAGTADQFDSVITLSGDATSVTLSNSTWGAATDLTVAVDLSQGDVTVDTDRMTATQGGSSVIGSVSHSTDGAFPARWLPLLASVDNSVGVSHDGSTLTVTIDHYARWL